MVVLEMKNWLNEHVYCPSVLDWLVLAWTIITAINASDPIMCAVKMVLFGTFMISIVLTSFTKWSNAVAEARNQQVLPYDLQVNFRVFRFAADLISVVVLVIYLLIAGRGDTSEATWAVTFYMRVYLIPLLLLMYSAFTWEPNMPRLPLRECLLCGNLKKMILRKINLLWESLCYAFTHNKKDEFSWLILIRNIFMVVLLVSLVCVLEFVIK